MNIRLEANGDKMDIDYETDCNVIEIWNDDHWNVIVLSDIQLDRLTEFLNDRKEYS
jgi:hypothetical protein